MIRFLPAGVDWFRHLRAAQESVQHAAKAKQVEQAGGPDAFRALVRHLVAAAEMRRFDAEPIMASERDVFESRVRQEYRDSATALERYGLPPLSFSEVRAGGGLKWRPTWPAEVEEARQAKAPVQSPLPDFYDDAAKAKRFAQAHGTREVR